MELLQNQRYKPGKIPYRYFHEIRIQVESIIEVCQEGEISMYEADNIIHEELLTCLDYQDELWKKQYNFENGIDEITEYNEVSTSLFSPEELADLNELGREWTKNDLNKALDSMEDYNNFLIEAQEKLEEIFDCADYNKKRKAKIKQHIIRDGIQLSPKIADNTNTLTSKMGLTERSLNFLIPLFPELEKDYPLLVKHGFWNNTDKGPRWGKSKNSLTDYFKSIRPERIKRIPWMQIGNLFDEKGLKNSASTNGNSYTETEEPKDKKPSKDFEEWLKIKNGLADK